jgi:hypothetical protein
MRTEKLDHWRNKTFGKELPRPREQVVIPTRIVDKAKVRPSWKLV